MKPIKLKFKGINSFSEQTEIDFERLTQNGIFGIFGDTGSGKSTILDCINFALYGKVERSREKLDIINYRSETAEVEFQFDVLSDGKRKRYCVERSLKKKSGLHKALLYEDEKCIADNATTVTKKITDALGVDAEDFRKCIALPQGEFAQFVKSQPSERIALIERLFSLSVYGDRLKERLKARETRSEFAYQTISAKLSLYGDISEETLKELEVSIANLKIQTETLSAEFKAAEKDLQQQKITADKCAELDVIKKKLAELDSLKSRMNEIRSWLKSEQICRSVLDTDKELTEKLRTIGNIGVSLKETEKNIKREKDNLNKLNSRLEQENYEDRITKCIELSAKYKSCEGKSEKLLMLEKSLEKKRKEFRQKDEKLSGLKIQLKQAENDVKVVETKLAECSSKDIDRIINVDFKGALLKSEYVNSLDYFVGLNGQVKFHKDGSDLYNFLERELKQQIEIYRDKVLLVKDFNLEEAQNKLKSIQIADKEREKLASELNNKTVALKDCQAAVNDCIKEIGIIQRDGEELKLQYEEIKSELRKVFGEVSDYILAEKSNLAELDNLKKQKAQLSAAIEDTNQKLSGLLTMQASALAERKTVENETLKLKSRLKSLLEKSGFGGVEECKTLIAGLSELKDAEKSLEEYDSKLISLTSRRAELERSGGIKDFSNQMLLDAEERKQSVERQLSTVRESIAVKQAEYSNVKCRLSEKKELQKQFNSAEKERNLINQLKELTKGNKFMEFIANEYLYDISSLASSTLLSLTDGRYFLSYTDNFYAGDNFNCGKLRGVNTMSGGETFLVSLSLALALSQTICASLKSIEFFFLDEGFGTLDETLVDTVLNALEKLKGSHFTIGIISHVEELKHRISNKITVNKATESHGSTVNISC